MPRDSIAAALREVARSVGASPTLIPFFDELFAPLSALGSSPRRIASLLALSTKSRVLDLACGKGAVAVEVARRHGCHVTGVDACPAFIESARALAAHHNVAHLCTWHLANIRRWAPRPLPRFDVAMMIGLDSVAEAAPRLRRFVNPRGLYIIDDAVRDSRHSLSTRLKDVPGAAECQAAIEALGDLVLRRIMLPRAAVQGQHRSISAALTATTRRLSKQHRKLRRPLAEFLARHHAALAVLLGPLRPTIWVIRRR